MMKATTKDSTVEKKKTKRNILPVIGVVAVAGVGAVVAVRRTMAAKKVGPLMTYILECNRLYFTI